MKKYWVIVVTVLFMFSCKTENKSSEASGQNPASTDQAGQVTGSTPTASSSGVYHYVCPDKCVGGHSNNAGNCPVCGNQLTHNQAWHDLPENQATQTPQTPQAVPNPTPDQIQPLDLQQPQVENINVPAGADGKVYHYVCKAGCKGGHGDNAGNCPVCSKPMAHNQAFHNK